MARKLKGKATEKLKSDKKEKMEKTLKRMDVVREIDNVNIRDLITKKLSEYAKEREKADQYIIKFKGQVQQLEAQKLKIDGALISLNEVLKESSKDAD